MRSSVVSSGAIVDDFDIVPSDGVPGTPLSIRRPGLGTVVCSIDLRFADAPGDSPAWVSPSTNDREVT